MLEKAPENMKADAIEEQKEDDTKAF